MNVQIGVIGAIFDVLVGTVAVMGDNTVRYVGDMGKPYGVSKLLEIKSP